MDNPINDPQPPFVRGDLIGERGPQGVRGVPGERGIRGVPGPQGEEGEIGARGVTGPVGRTGPEGFRGAEGEPVYWADILKSFADNAVVSNAVVDATNKQYTALNNRFARFYEDAKRVVVVAGAGIFLSTVWHVVRLLI